VRWIKRFSVRVLRFSLVFLLSLALLEALCSVAAWLQYRTLNVGELNAADLGNTYVADQEGYAGVLQPHPYLSHVFNAKGRGNNVGTHGRDFPIVKDPNVFTVLVTGGSVADEICISGLLEAALYRFDFGKPVVVLNGGGGGWKEPNQLIVTAIYGSVCDAVITLDGFNEMYFCCGTGPRLELPSNNFGMINPILKGGFDRLGASWQIQRLRDFSNCWPLRSLFYATKVARAAVISSMPPQSDDPPTVESIFSLPADWSQEQKTAFNIEQYRKYTRAVDALASLYNVKVAHFIQPCPAIGKQLTPEERRVVGSLDYAQTYQQMADALVEIGALSLLDLYSGVDESLYRDHVHVNNEGYRLMADRIALKVAGPFGVRVRRQ
jgi:hypothetical protein